eukprot:6177854-Pleurochrysis_carterae.AAC.1
MLRAGSHSTVNRDKLEQGSTCNNSWSCALQFIINLNVTFARRPQPSPQLRASSQPGTASSNTLGMIDPVAVNVKVQSSAFVVHFALTVFKLQPCTVLCKRIYYFVRFMSAIVIMDRGYG